MSEIDEPNGHDSGSAHIVADVADRHVQQLADGLVVRRAAVSHRHSEHAAITDDGVAVADQLLDQRICTYIQKILHIFQTYINIYTINSHI